MAPPRHVLVVVPTLLLAAPASAMAVSVLPTGSDPQDARPASRVTAEAVDDRLVQGLKVFGPGRVQAQGESAADQKAPVVDDTLGLNPALARKARTFDDASYFIVPGNDAVALVDGRGTGIVDDVDHALSGEGLTVQDCATNGTQVRVVGLLPNGATNPTIIAADGSPRSLEVINNVYVALFDRTAAALPQTLEFQFDGQDRRVAVPIPSDLLDANCMKSPPGAPVPPGTAG